MSDLPIPPAWEHLGSSAGSTHRLFRVRNDLLRNPRNRETFERVVLETPDWVNVVAITRERRVVLVRQYRFGVREVTLEIPGGMVDPGESAEAAARRELLEESGYEAPEWRSLGSVQPNPAFLDNRCHLFLAERAELVAAPDPDPGEDIAVTTAPLDAIRGMVLRGEIAHALVICALARVIDLRGDPGSA